VSQPPEGPGDGEDDSSPGHERRRRHLHCLTDEQLWQRIVHSAGKPCPEWDVLSHRLTKEVLPILVAWMRNGTLRDRASSAGEDGGRVRGLGDVPERLPLPDADATELAGEMIVRALRRLRRPDAESWRPDGGRSLKSYVVTGCLLQLPDAYRFLFGTRRRRQPGLKMVALDAVDPADVRPGPHDIVGRRAEIEAWAREDPVRRCIARMASEGYRAPEIHRVLDDEGFSVPIKRIRALLKDFIQRFQDPGSAG
jgi:hypothetical protein